MQEYQSKLKKDLYANLMLQAFTTNASVGAVLNIVYLKPVANASAFAPFYSIPTTGDTTKIQSLTQMMSGQRAPPLPVIFLLALSCLSIQATLGVKSVDTIPVNETETEANW